MTTLQLIPDDPAAHLAALQAHRRRLARSRRSACRVGFVAALMLPASMWFAVESIHALAMALYLISFTLNGYAFTASVATVRRLNADEQRIAELIAIVLRLEVDAARRRVREQRDGS